MSNHTKNAGVFAHELMSTGTVFGDGVEVRIGGEDAYTDHKTIQLPGFDMNAEVSQSTARAMRGYVDHEAAHIDVTPPDMMERAHSAGGQSLKRMVNAIEDLRIEKLRFRKYPGAKKNIEATLEATAGATVGRMMLGEASDVRDTDYGLSLLGRLRSGYHSPKAQQAYDMLDDEAKALCEEFVDEAMACETPDQVEALSARVLARVGAKHEDDEPDDEEDKRAVAGKPCEDGEDGESDEPNDDEPTDGDEPNDGEGDDAGKAKVRDDQQEAGDDSTSGGKGAAKVDDWKPKEAIAMPEDAPIADGDRKTHSGVVVDLSGDCHQVLETKADFETALGNIKHYHRNFEDSETDLRAAWGRSKRKLRKLAGPMLGRVQAALMTETETVWRGGYKAGRLDQRRLVQAAMGSETVWRQREDGRDLDNAVMLLVDMSGSMNGGGKMKMAGQAALTLAMVCEKAGVPACVMGFDAYDTLRRNTAAGAREPNNTYVFKRFSTPLEKAWYGMSVLPSAPMYNNADADAIIKAEQMLFERQERTKTLIVLSDGSPACYGSHYSHQYTKYTRKTIERIEKRPDWNVFGIGILDDSVEHLYRDFEVLWTLDELPRAVTDKLCRSLLNKPLALNRAA